LCGLCRYPDSRLEMLQLGVIDVFMSMLSSPQSILRLEAGVGLTNMAHSPEAVPKLAHHLPQILIHMVSAADMHTVMKELRIFLAVYCKTRIVHNLPDAQGIMLCIPQFVSALDHALGDATGMTAHVLDTLGLIFKCLPKTFQIRFEELGGDQKLTELSDHPNPVIANKADELSATFFRE